MPLFGKDKATREIEREVKYRNGIVKVEGYIAKSKQTQRELWKLGKEALQLGDQRQFENIAKAWLRVGGIINRWQRYIVAAKTVNVQRGQVKATADFVGSMAALSDSMMAGAKPEDVVKMQVQLEKALARAQTLDDSLAVVMDASSDTIFSSEGLSDEELRTVEKTMAGEAATDEGSAADSRIAEGLKRIEAEMKKELGK